jgi:CHASE3 domain sensor protein
VDIKSGHNKYIGSSKKLLDQLEKLDPTDPQYKKLYSDLEQAITMGLMV